MKKEKLRINDLSSLTYGKEGEEKYNALVDILGEEILSNPTYLKNKELIQHGCSSIFEHCHNVALESLKIVARFNIKCDIKSLVRGTLLHDYFLYDWHDKKNRLPHHAYKHPLYALKNAKKDFDISKTEANIIASHMFPLCFILPRCKEALIVSFADKISTLKERKLYKKKSKLSK